MGKVRGPDDIELLVKEHLIHRGFSDVPFEPDGNIPPDFLADKRIAVEARVLNQHYGEGDDAYGLEEDAVPLFQKVRKIARSFGPPTTDESWFVWLSFSRPIEDWATLRPKIIEIFKEFAARPERTPDAWLIGRRFEIQVVRASKPQPWFFTMGGRTDSQSGGWMLSELDRNLKIVVAQKAKKIAPYRHRYSEWWLCLADYISLGLKDPFEQQEFRKFTKIEHPFDKIVLIDPDNETKFFEL